MNLIFAFQGVVEPGKGPRAAATVTVRGFVVAFGAPGGKGAFIHSLHYLDQLEHEAPFGVSSATLN